MKLDNFMAKAAAYHHSFSTSTSSSATSTSAVSTTSTSSAAAATSSISISEDSTTSSGLNLAWKAGLSGYPGIQTLSTFTDQWAPYISWYSNYEPVAPNLNLSTHTILGAPMLWGKGDQCLTGADGPVDLYRLDNFTTYVSSGETTPDIFFGFYEPDCDCDSSSHIPNVTTAYSKWNEWIAPLASRGIKLGSPPMCTQLDQTWLSGFASLGATWDITSIHVNKPTAAEGIEVVEYYSHLFGKPIWVSEFTCVNDTNWSSCGDQDVVNEFISLMVEYFEGNDDVLAYGANNGEGVPGVWNLMSQDWPPVLTATGLHYQSVLEGLIESYDQC
ncbi:glycosyl hydrolase catalytic core-domain-containing protein [Delphinella strobiligena]|nr:glycosyl hydrolase catalytic core-domain-containing protein [Delphinella strobiligena]